MTVPQTPKERVALSMLEGVSSMCPDDWVFLWLLNATTLS